jgi:hypothetical protein
VAVVSPVEAVEAVVVEVGNMKPLKIIICLGVALFLNFLLPDILWKEF